MTTRRFRGTAQYLDYCKDLSSSPSFGVDLTAIESYFSIQSILLFPPVTIQQTWLVRRFHDEPVTLVAKLMHIHFDCG